MTILLLEWLPPQPVLDLVWLGQASVPAPRPGLPEPAVAVVVGPKAADGKDGDPGPAGAPGQDAPGAVDPGDLTLIFDNKLF